MPEPNELIVIELPPSARMRLSNQILRRMEEMGFKGFQYNALDLGFHLPAEWPDDPSVDITMAQLAVLAIKLKMRLTIGSLNFPPLPATADAELNTQE